SYTKGDYAAALRWFEEFLELKPDSPNDWFYLSVAAKQNRDYERARSAGERVLQDQPHRVANLVNLADTYRKLSQPERARELTNAALRADPDHTSAQALDRVLKKAGV